MRDILSNLGEIPNSSLSSILTTLISVCVTLTALFLARDFSKKTRGSNSNSPDDVNSRLTLSMILNTGMAVSSFKSGFLKGIDAVFNFNLYKVAGTIKLKSKDDTKSLLALTELVVKHQAKNNTLTYVYFIFGILLHNLFIKLEFVKTNYAFEVVIIIVFVAFILKQIILNYRLKKGLYGTNEFEVREIIKFILDEKNKHYFDGKGGQRSIFNTPEETIAFKKELEEYDVWGRYS